MSPTNLLFVAIGAVSLLLGLTVLVTAIRGAPGTDPKSTAMLIGGMMATAFGLLMAGFAIAYSTGKAPQ
jgi:Na+/H+ antiporter NhaC